MKTARLSLASSLWKTELTWKKTPDTLECIFRSRFTFSLTLEHPRALAPGDSPISAFCEISWFLGTRNVGLRCAANALSPTLQTLQMNVSNAQKKHCQERVLKRIGNELCVLRVRANVLLLNFTLRIWQTCKLIVGFCKKYMANRKDKFVYTLKLFEELRL